MPDPHISKVPANAVAPDGGDLVAPAAELLRGLSLLPKEGESAGALSAFTGTPDSVAVIESGATALSKMWAAGLGTAVAALWVRVATWWPDQDPDVQTTVLWAAAIATAALVAGLAYIVGSDVRGRAAAMVATVKARSEITQALIREAAALYKPEGGSEPAEQIVPISPPMSMKWIHRQSKDEGGWIASALRFRGDRTDYWLSKGCVQKWVPSAEVERG